MNIFFQKLDIPPGKTFKCFTSVIIINFCNWRKWDQCCSHNHLSMSCTLVNLKIKDMSGKQMLSTNFKIQACTNAAACMFYKLLMTILDPQPKIKKQEMRTLLVTFNLYMCGFVPHSLAFSCFSSFCIFYYIHTVNPFILLLFIIWKLSPQTKPQP